MVEKFNKKLNPEKNVPESCLLNNYRKALIHSSILGITDRDGNIVYVNEEFSYLCKYAPEELIGKNQSVLTSDEFTEYFFNKDHRTLTPIKNSTQCSLICKTKDGNKLTIDTTIIPFIDENKGVFEYVFIRNDHATIKDLEASLKRAHLQLKSLKSQLETEKNQKNQKTIAINEIISHIDRNQDSQKDAIAKNLNNVIIPLLKTLEESSTSLDKKFLKLTIQSLQEISNPLVNKWSISQSLTPKELQICNMIKNGLSAKEVAELTHSSPRTIDKHRENIRKKLGLTSKKINLASFLIEQLDENDNGV